MKNLRKSVSVFLMLLIALFCFSTVAFASTTEQDGLKVELKTDKENYSSNEDIKINVTVTNTNDFTIDVKIDTLLPDEFTLKDDSQSTSSEAVSIPAGEQIKFSVIAVLKGDNTDVSSSDTYTATETSSQDDSKQQVQGQTDTNSKATAVNKSTDKTTNSNDKSPYTGTDYAIMTGLGALFCIGIVFLILCLKRYRKKTTKVISSVLCVVLAVSSLVGLFDFKASAEKSKSDNDSSVTDTNDNTTSSIDLSETVKFDGKEYTITVCISYKIDIGNVGKLKKVDKNIVEDFNLKATPFDILVGENTSVLFSATCNLSSTDNISPAIYDEDNNLITYLYDNGQNGDEKANDNIYSAKCNLYSDTEKHVNYYVVCNNKISSNEKDIFFYKNFTEKELTEATNFESKLAEIDSKYIKSNEYIKEKDINSYLTEICNLCEKQKDIVKSYDYDKSNNSVYIELTSGMTYLIVPPIEGRLAGGKPKEIVTFEPNKTSIQTSLAKLELGEKYYSTYDNANKIKEFDSNFTYNDNNQFENDEVTIDVLKNLSPFSVMIWNGHGGYNKKKNIVALMTSTELPAPTFMDKYSSYVADIKDKRIVKGGGLDNLDGMSSCGITSKFIDTYFPQLDEAIIYLGACNSLANWSFGESLTLKGASAIYGYNISITAGPEAQIRTRLFNDLCSISEITKDYNTVEEAYYSNYNDSISKHGFSMYYNNSSKRLLDKKTNVNGSLSGYVKDSETKKPIKGVKIEIIDNKSDDLTPIVTVTTDKDGKFNTKPIPYGEYSISFSHDEYGFYGTTVDVYQDNVVLTEPILLKKIENGITGYVYDKDDFINNGKNTPIADVTIEVYNSTTSDLVGTCKTDENGKYSIAVDKNDSYNVTFKKSGYEDNKLTTMVNGGFNKSNVYMTKNGSDDNVKFAGGDGTEENPYQVSTSEQLNAVRNNLSAHYVQINDIDMSDWGNWEPIGTRDNQFVGNYNGQKNKIINLTITFSKNNTSIGLFGYGAKSIITNVNLEESNINTLDMYYFTGSIVGYGGTLINCSATGSINSKCYSGGGLAGIADVIENCTFNGTVNFLCFSDFNFRKDLNIDILNMTNNYLSGCYGGICGIGNRISFSKTKGEFNASTTYQSFLGGISGYSETIKQCYNGANLKIQTDGNASNCPEAYVGGISGVSKEVSDSYNIGNIVSISRNYAGMVGGITGLGYGNYSNCYNTGDLNNNSKYNWYKGGIIGLSNFKTSNINYCYSNIKILAGNGNVQSQIKNTNSMYLTEEEFKDKSSFKNFDFSNVWSISKDENNGYPYLKAFEN